MTGWHFSQTAADEAGRASLYDLPPKAIPEQIWGKWIVTRELPTTTISCWGEADAKTLLGTETEYSRDIFRWKDVVTTRSVVEIKTVNAGQFHDEHSGQGSGGSQVTFRQLGSGSSLGPVALLPALSRV